MEALFELKWGPDTPEMLGYPIVVGALYEKLKDTYPEVEDLPLHLVPPELTAHMVRHRFRKAKNGWPLVQIGPGILAVNETEGYTTWNVFYEQIRNATQKLYEAHPKSKELIPQSFALRYINAVEFDYDRQDVLIFLQEKFKTKIAVTESLFNVGFARRRPGEVLLRLSFPLSKPAGSGIIQFATGTKKDNRALVWELIANSIPPEVAPLPEGANAWLRDAHDAIEHWFVELTKGELLESFKRKPH